MKNLAFLFSLIVLSSGICLAQTSAFTYQGKLASGGAPANGDHQFEFKLFDAATGTNQIGTTQTITSAVQNGSFSTRLDFGATAFVAGQDRWLEISVRLNGSSDPFTVLNPRQQVNSVPFAVRSLKATNADTADNATTATNAMTANTATTAENVTGVVQVSNGGTGSATQNFIDLTSNQTIGGNKTFGGALSGNVVSTATQYDINGQRILSGPGAFNLFVGRLAGRDNTGGNNVFVGDSAGLINTTGSSNAFFGYGAGQQNTTGGNNSFFGDNAGFSNSAGSSNNSFFGQSAGRSNAASDNSFFGTLAGADNFSGTLNSFFGSSAGRINSLGNSNSFFGSFSGDSNTLGGGNAFFGAGAGGANSTGSSNNFFGRFAGQNNTSGDDNSFIGRGTGGSNISGSSNTLIGSGADVGSGTLSNATAIGVGAIVSQSNSLVLGNTSSNTTIGIGVSAPAFKLHVVDSQNTGLRVQTNTAGGTVASFGKFGAFRIDAEPNVAGGRLTVLENGNVGIGTANPTAKLEVDGNVKTNGFLSARTLIVTSSDGTCWIVGVSTIGFLHVVGSVTCP